MSDLVCPRRAEMAGMFNPPKGPDEWRQQEDGSRTCSFCGSLHPDDFVDILERYLKGEPGYYFSTTTKGYKAYANRPGVKNAGDGGIKFYFQHLTCEPGTPEADKLDALWRRVVSKFRYRMEKMFGT